MEYTSIDQFKYKIEDNNIILDKFISNKRYINIAPEYTINNKTYRVKKLKDNCFAECDIKEIILPTSLTEIPNKCFYNCICLEKINLPSTIDKIKTSAFQNCISLTEIDLSNITRIGKGAFNHCENLKKIKLSDRLNKIPKGCFNNCYNLNELALPDEITIIDNYAFTNCTKLRELRMPKKIKSISYYAFSPYNNLIIEDFENQNIKIKNNNIYQKENKNNKINYILINSLQKEDTLIIEEDEVLDAFFNNNIKNIIIKGTTTESWYVESDQIDHLIILGKVNCDYDTHITTDIKSLYLSEQTNIFNLFGNVIKNIYYNNTQEKANELLKNQYIAYENIIYKKDIDQLLEEGYNFKQIDLIIKGYQKGILLSNINKNIDDGILRDIIHYFTPTDIELYNILELLQKEESTLEDNLKLQEMIKDSKEEKQIEHDTKEII